MRGYTSLRDVRGEMGRKRIKFVTVEQGRAEAETLLGRAIYAALDSKFDTPAHKAARRMVEELIAPFLTDDELVQSVANFSSWTFGFWEEEKRIQDAPDRRLAERRDVTARVDDEIPF